jgi:mRNA interferase RelE/StbE
LSEGPRRVVIAPAAQRQLRRLPPGDTARLRVPIVALATDPRPPSASKLTDTEFWRLRVGGLRVIFVVDDESGDVIVLRVARRSESTYRDLR